MVRNTQKLLKRFREEFKPEEEDTLMAEVLKRLESGTESEVELLRAKVQAVDVLASQVLLEMKKLDTPHTQAQATTVIVDDDDDVILIE
jgi:hypothetical protein